MKKILIFGIILFSQIFFSQEDKLKFSGNAEVFYSFDFNEPSNHIKQNYLYNYNRHNEFNLNLAMLKANYETENVRTNLALMAGTYASDNLSAEKDVFKNIYEANIGFKISKSKNLWIDAGILPSHIGWETAIGKDNLTLTRSLAAENSPYFETGAKISYTSESGKWFLSGLILNGWQRIARVEGNQTISFGHQITYKPNEKLTINSSSFIGNDKPTSEKKMRYFHDFYAINQWNPKFQTIVGFDLGAEQKEKGSSQYYSWFSPNFLAKYQWNEKTSVSGRVEYFSDKNNVIIAPQNNLSFQVLGISANVDYQIYKNVLWRLEARNFSSKDLLFMKNDNFSKNSFAITTSISAWF